MLTPTYTIYIYNTSRFTCSIESSTVNRGLKRVLSFFAKRVHATYIPCVTMCRVYVDTYLKKLRGQRRKKTARPFVHTRDGTVRVCVVYVCARVCHSFREQLAIAVYGIRRVNIDTEGGLAARRERSVSMLHAIKVIHFSACVTRYRVACSQHRSAANVR